MQRAVRDRPDVRETRGMRSPHRSGFTLIEILVVIVVIAVLASMVAPNVFKHVGEGKNVTARSQIEALGAYRFDTGAHPTTTQDPGALWPTPVQDARPADPSARNSGRTAMSPDAKRPQAQSGVLYYGATAIGRGWLVYLDFERGEGVRYAPARNLGLCHVRRDSAGTVSWSSPGGGEVERFEGKPTPTGLNGVVTITRLATGSIVRTSEVRLNTTSLPAASADTVSDLYSNVNYVERAGDLTGAEIVFLEFGKDSLVFVTMYEGRPDGPWVMTDVKWSGDTLSGAYGSPPPSRISFVRDGNALRDRWDRLINKRSGGLRGLLLARRHTPCSDPR